MALRKFFVMRTLAVVLGAITIGAATGVAMTPAAKVEAECEHDECEGGWFWDSCEPNGINMTSCDVKDSTNCQTRGCAAS